MHQRDMYELLGEIYIQMHHIHGTLITEQQVNELNHLYSAAHIARLTPGNTLAVTERHKEDQQQ